MRLVLSLICLAALAVAGWHAATSGLPAPFFAGGQRIEAMIVDGVRAALGPEAAEIEVTASGRDVLLSGRTDSAETRGRIVAAAAAAPMVRQVADRIELPVRAMPFRLVATKSDAGLSLSGNVPGAAAGETLLADARAISPKGVDADLRPASGAPADREMMARAGLRAVAPLDEGRLEIEGASVALTGAASDLESREAALAVARGAPGAWRIDIATAAPLAFTARKTPDGAIIVGGGAPDETVRDALMEAAALISAQPVGGEIELSGGEAPEGWETLIGQGLEALRRTIDGFLTVSGAERSLSGTIGSPDDGEAVEALLGTGWRIEIAVVPQGPPPAEVTLEYSADGRLAAGGELPAALSPDSFAAMLPGVDLSALGQAETGEGVGWDRALDGLSIVLPRFGAAAVRLSDRRLAVEGELKRGFSAEGARAALLSALPRDWELALDAAETDPLAEVVVAKDRDSVVLSGLVPAGLEPAEAMTLMGGAVGGGLAGGGAGDPGDWSRTLAGLGELIGVFETARARIGSGEVEVTGELLPGYPAERVASRLAETIPADWRTSIDAAETPAGEGDRRVSLDTGEPEIFRRGFWLPELDFPVTLERCESEADSALASGQVRFVTGSAELDDAGRALVDRLAAIAVRCLNSSAMRLEIAGHTESVGNDAQNQALSEARAEAVLGEFLARGVRQDALSTVGHGESQPIDSNDTTEGRARNRRIAFNWSEE